LRSWLLDVSKDELAERSVFAEACWAVFKVLGETAVFRDLVEVLLPAFEVADATCELDADLTGLVHSNLLRVGER
jgi:hypothetical protein